jgi:hypothetical protein
MRDGKQIAVISLRAEEGRVHLSYSIRVREGEWQDVEEPVRLMWQPCRFGGRRPYFVCPGVVNGVPCRRRVEKLYRVGRDFLCRHCHGLSYGSQSEDRYGRALRRAAKIRMRLGGEPEFEARPPLKPKGMHQATYERLRNQMLEAEDAALEGLLRMVQRIRKRDNAARRRRGPRDRARSGRGQHAGRHDPAA